MSTVRRSARLAAKATVSVAVPTVPCVKPNATKKAKIARKDPSAVLQGFLAELNAQRSQRIKDRITTAFKDLSLLLQFDDMYEATVKYLFALTSSPYFNISEYDISVFQWLFVWVDNHEYLYDDLAFSGQADNLHFLIHEYQESH